MTTRHQLYDNSSPAFSSPGNLSGSQATGTEFSTTSGGYISGLRFWRQTAGWAAPLTLSLWDYTNNVLLARVSGADVQDNGGTGWQDSPLADPILLVNGRNYHVMMYQASGQPAYQSLIATRSAAPSPLVFGDHSLVYTSGSDGNGGSNFDTAYYPVDVIWTDDGSPIVGSGRGTVGGGGTGTTVADLADWLDTGIGTQPNSAPLKTQVLASGSSGFAAIKAIVDSVLTSVGSGLATTVGTINTNLVNLANTWSSSLATALQNMSDDFATFFAGTAGTAGGPTGALSGRSEFSGTGWNMVDSVDFTFQKSWDVAADLYTVSLSNIPSRVNNVDVDGATWRPRIGWWALRNGDLLSRREFLNWENNYVEDQGRRMKGIVVRTQPEVTGTIEAWVLT